MLGTLFLSPYMENFLGKLIVIDGTDGSGKATQTQLLAQRLRDHGYQVEIADFPQYGKKSAGLVEEYLNGKYGTAEQVGPYRASLFYACDRYDASFQINDWLKQGKIVIANRYVSANMGHQGGKIADDQTRQQFFNWLYNLEYEIFRIPKPDLNIILHVDASLAQQMVDNKETRNYILNGAKRDIHEKDINHLRQAEKIYLEIAKTFPDFYLIECCQNRQIMTREEISNLIWHQALKILKLEPEQITLAPNFISDKSISEQSELNKTLLVERISPLAKLPRRAYESDAGFDLFSADYYTLMPGEHAIINTGIKIIIPEGLVGLIWDKSGIARQGVHTMAGVVDAGFRGELTVNLINLSHDIYNISPGQKIAQLLIQKVEIPEIIEGEVNHDTDRSEGCFGSSGIF